MVMTSLETWSHHIDGGAVESTDTRRFEVLDPATADPFAAVPEGTAEDVHAAMVAACEAADSWRDVTPEERASALGALADRLDEHAEELAQLEVRESGKTIDQCRTDVALAADSCRFYAGAADKLAGETVISTPGETGETLVEPLGVVGVIIPWNWPPMHTTDFAAPAIAAGNTVVLKPAPETPLSSLRIAQLAADLLPDGVLNVVTGGAEAGAALGSHRDVDKLAFTGNDTTGVRVLKAAAEHVTPVLLELGGKNPALVFDDAELNRAVSGVLRSTFKNNGQSCANTERLLVHREIYDEFLGMFADAVEDLVIGPGSDGTTQIGPVISAAQYDRVRGYMDRAEADGATVLARAELPDALAEGGFWIEPTIFGDVDPASEFATEEVFGPVAAVFPVDDEAEAVAMANDTEYGLAATIWTTDVDRARRVAREIDAGVIGVNSPSGATLGLPFGGFGRSGTGKKKDFIHTMREFTRIKAVHEERDIREFPL